MPDRTPTIDDISAPSPPSDVPDELTKGAMTRLEHAERLARLTSFKQDVRERKKFGNKLFRVVCYWLCGVMTLLVLSGLPKVIHIRFAWLETRVEGFALNFSDNVLIALITTTTLNVIGLFLVVANYLFPKPRD